ncbi:MAG TPA: amino acid carrier protein [Clostridiales bacterium]|nr:amino acid carrier protein [Clostridiales bacterium]
MAFFSHFSALLWGGPILAACILVGGYYSLRTGFFQLFGLPVWWRSTVGALLRPRSKERDPAAVTPLQALSTALAATIGTGSIAGVAAAIFYGGPGTVFWMWISALLGMMTGCAEKLLAVRHRERGPDGQWRGGPMEYIRLGLHLPGLAKLYALFLVCETLVGGTLAQSNSIATALNAATGVSPRTVGIVLALITAVVLAGGIRRIARLSELLVPVMALLFLGCGLAVILFHWSAVPQALEQIVTYAFAPKAVAGGYAMGAALRYGVARGVFTSEAGLGVSSIAHACADVDHPARQGMWGIFEVGVSTLLICTVTALVILTSGLYQPQEALALLEQGQPIPTHLLGAPLVAASFSTLFGQAGTWVISVSLILFAFTSLVGSGFYGQRGLDTLAPHPFARLLYRLAFPLCILFGAVGDLGAVWELVDFFNALLALPNLAALLLLSPEALYLLRQWLEQQSTPRAPHIPRREKRPARSARRPASTSRKNRA